jgi:hypothetical protein
MLSLGFAVLLGPGLAEHGVPPADGAGSAATLAAARAYTSANVVSVRKPKAIKVSARPKATPKPTATPTPTPSPTPTAIPTSAPTSPLRDRVLFGSSVNTQGDALAELNADEQLLGGHLDIASTFSDWEHVIGGPLERGLCANGTRSVLVAWEPWNLTFADVYQGRQDAYLGSVATAMRTYPGNLYVRPWPEMNALWSPWQPKTATRNAGVGSAQEFIQAWRYLVTYFHSRGVDNLKFVFNPDASDYSQNVRIPDIWPGHAYVDVLGIDGYNWGNSALGAIDTGDRWREFPTIFQSMYTILTVLDPTAPVWVTEVGSKEPQKEDDSDYPKASSPVDPLHDKGTWVHNLFSLTSFPRLTAVVFFNRQKERDWRFDSSAEALSAFRQELAQLRTSSASLRG